MKRQTWIQLTQFISIDPVVIEAVTCEQNGKVSTWWKVKVYVTSGGHYETDDMSALDSSNLYHAVMDQLVPK